MILLMLGDYRPIVLYIVYDGTLSDIDISRDAWEGVVHTERGSAVGRDVCDCTDID